MTFELIDLQELGESALEDFANSPRAASSDVATAAQRLTAKVEATYAVAAKLAHREPTLEGTVAIWSKMMAICDQAASEIQRITPAGDHKQSLDRILDLRSAAERRRDLHS
jgi:hypothetical protein